MTSFEFGLFVNEVCNTLQHISETSPESIAACKSGEDFEACVVQAVQDTLTTARISATVHYTAGSHVFPDIVVEFSDGAKYGIEVKSSSSSNSKNWKINGNSVLGSTKEDVIDTYIIFGKTHIKNQGFRCRRYEDAVANVAVTHSPRYAIDMEIAPDQTFLPSQGSAISRSLKQLSRSVLLQITSSPRGSGLGGSQRVRLLQFVCFPPFRCRNEPGCWDTALHIFLKYFLPMQVNFPDAPCGWQRSTVSYLHR